ncbi:MAG: hypothetical protein H0X17_03235 [Deltaproteobacteria bacterium]|nr:hypothetical protein [Deltaproteobacteria bacterium]
MPPRHHIEYVFDEVTGLYCQVTPDTRFTLVYARDAHASLLFAALPGPCIRVWSREELVDQLARPVAVVFVDTDLLAPNESCLTKSPCIGVLGGSPSALSTIVDLVGAFPWLSHVVSTTLLTGPLARGRLSVLLDRVVPGRVQHMLGKAGVGRIARLSKASGRDARFERIREFFAKHGVTPRTLTSINEVIEELVTNALYDAPLEAGYFDGAVQRTEDVVLPSDRACEISYGIEDATAFVRVCDTFGALTRARLMAVLERCNAQAVELDESRGGAGLGIWRVFSMASTVSISVVPGRLTDIVIGFESGGRRASKQLLALQLSFVAVSDASEPSPDGERDFLDHSVTLMQSVSA